MRMTWLGGFIQTRSTAEGSILQELHLLQFTHSKTHFDVEPTYLLREMFPAEPPMEDLYPLLVEFVMRFRYPKMVNRMEIEKKLTELGITAAGLDKLNLMLRNHYRIWDADF